MQTQKIYKLAADIGHKILSKQWHISCAESCTGGGLAFALTSVAGSSQWFKQSFVTYCNEAKQTMLGVDSATLEKHGAVSQQTVEQMALGCAARANAELAVSISGIAGPGGGSDDKPVGLVWFGFSLDGNITSTKQVFSGDREQVRLQAIEFALDYVNHRV
jgi:nicotinamide-nucleotide amidase